MAAVGRPAGVAHLEDAEILDLIKNAQGVGTEGLRPGSAVTALATLCRPGCRPWAAPPCCWRSRPGWGWPGSPSGLWCSAC